MAENKTMDVNCLVERLLNNREYCNRIYLEFKKDNDGLNNVSGFIESEILKQLIKKSKRNYKLRAMLADILLYVNASSMTDENFQMLLRYPHKCRKTYLSNICHVELSFYQMNTLNRYPLAMEAFVWLFDKICCYDCFTKEDMLCLLRENPDVRPSVINDCILFAIENYGSSEKVNAAQEWIE